MKLSNLKIGTKIVGILVLPLVASSAISAFVLSKLLTIDGVYHALVKEDLAAEATGLKLEATQQELGRIIYKMTSRTDPKAVEEENKLLQEGLKAISTNYMPALEKLASDTNPNEVARIKALVADLAPVAVSIGEVAQSGDQAATLALANAKFHPIRTALDAEIGKLVKALESEVDRKDAAATATTREVMWESIAAILAVLVGAIVIGFWIARSTITRPLAALTREMSQIAAGDYTVEVGGTTRGDEIGAVARATAVFKENGLERIRLEKEAEAAREAAEAERRENQRAAEEAAARQAEVVEALAEGLAAVSRGDLTIAIDQAFPAEYVKLKDDFNAAVAQLKDALSGVVGNVGTIRSGADEIAQASDDLSRRTEQQAASLEQTAAALEQITATVKRTASGSQQAASAVTAARGDAEKSGEVVRNAISAMGEIEKSSAEISQIIGVIDEIAFQTNLLALNAGVEAARAGDAGRGFAVVAQEVRALAQRSAEAAKEIKGLISTSSEHVDRGVTLVGETGQSLERIVQQVASIDGLVREISASAQEQSTGLSEINTAVNQMDQMVQQNAAMVEQSTAACHSLRGQASELGSLMSRFNVGADEARAARASVPARPAAKPAAKAPANPVHAQQAKLEAFARPARGGGAAAAVKEDDWTEF